jgi:retron-type reverse transcriptase
VVERLAELTPNELLDFIDSATPLERRWPKLPIAARESILEAWIRARTTNSELPGIAAKTCPSLVLDAVRWGEDHMALAPLFFGEAAERAVKLMKSLGGRRIHAGWCEAIRIIRRSKTIPASLLAIAKTDRKLLQDLVDDALPAFRQTSLEGFDPTVFIVPALHFGWLAKQMEETFSVKALRAALPRVRTRLASKPRLLAAAELSIAVGMRHALALAYLSTRRFPPAERSGSRFDAYYQSWTLPKRSGGKRTITAPVSWLMALQRSMLEHVFQHVPCHEAATGFLRGKSIADNARPHIGKRVVVNVDIAGFFPNTRFLLIRRAVNVALPKWVSDRARGLAADICAYAGALPIGAPTSPAIANIVMRSADTSIAKIARRHSLSYTRYADDITLSGDDPTRVLPFVQDVLKDMNYVLDPKKTNIFRRGRRQVVTGLVVNDKVSIPRTIRRRLRAAVHRAASQNLPSELVWHGRSMSVQQLEGRIAFAGVAHPEEARRLAGELRGVGKEA